MHVPDWLDLAWVLHAHARVTDRLLEQVCMLCFQDWSSVQSSRQGQHVHVRAAMPQDTARMPQSGVCKPGAMPHQRMCAG